MYAFIFVGHQPSQAKTAVPTYVFNPLFTVPPVCIISGGTTNVYTNKMELQKVLQQLSTTHIAVFWDVMLETFWLKHVLNVQFTRYTGLKQVAMNVVGNTLDPSNITFNTVLQHFKLTPPSKPAVSTNSWQTTVLNTKFCRESAEQLSNLATVLIPQLKNPAVEFKLIKATAEAFVSHPLRVDLAKVELIQQAVKLELHDGLQTVQQRSGVEIVEANIKNTTTFSKLLQAALGDDECIPMKPGTKDGVLIPALAKTDAGMQALLTHHNPCVSALAAARLGYKSGEMVDARLETLLSLAKSTGGLIYPYLNYSQATKTKRFSGGDGFSLHNLGKKGWQGKIRECLLPGTHKTFTITDFSTIEARVLAWIAGEQKLQTAFKNNEDVYQQFACLALGVKSAEKGSKERDLGKACILGLGYGMGKAKFAERTGTNLDTATQLVNVYRRTYPAIVALWARTQEAFINAALYDTYTDMNNNIVIKPGLVKNSVIISLPSGNELVYSAICITKATEAWKGVNIVYGSGQTNIYSSKLVENITQAIARDILADAVVRLVDSGLTPSFHVHDEIVVEGNEEELKRVLAVMTTVPKWADANQLTLAADGAIHQTYTK